MREVRHETRQYGACQVKVKVTVVREDKDKAKDK